MVYKRNDPPYPASLPAPNLITLVNLLKPLCAQDTSTDPVGWSIGNPFYGHSAIIALWIQANYGGALIRYYLRSLPGFEHLRIHHSNMLPDGTELDVTACQFEPVPQQEMTPLHMMEWSSLRDNAEVEANRYDCNLLESLPRYTHTREDVLTDQDVGLKYALLTNRINQSILEQHRRLRSNTSHP